MVFILFLCHDFIKSEVFSQFCFHDRILAEMFLSGACHLQEIGGGHIMNNDTLINLLMLIVMIMNLCYVLSQKSKEK